MKKRNGFVSNSSSTSFIIIGNYININDISFSKIKDVDIYVLGNWLADGQDIFKIENDEQLAIIKAIVEAGIYNEFEFVESYFFDDTENSRIDLKKLAKYGEADLIKGERDFSCSWDIDTMIDRYDRENEATKIAQKYLRNIKIKELNKNNNKI